MQFELTGALIGDILFSMEDQDGEYYIDTAEGLVAGGMDGLESYFDENPDIDQEDESRFISLPGWDSSDGFRLMERFAAGFRNPLIREELCSALGSGKGVFRAFKNTLGRHPEAEKLWFSFKDREMKREIIMWYNGLREEWGLEKIGVEPEETADLVLEDFRFRPFREEDCARAESLHRSCLEERKKKYQEKGDLNSAEALIRESPGGSLDNISGRASTAMIAESGGGEFAGYISGIKKDSVLYIQYLEVKAEYRGLGIGEALLVRFLEGIDHNEVSQALLDLPSPAEDFSRVLLREGFNPYAVRYWLSFREQE
jgi:GNAT superfamily N-acetyltransferase